MGTRQRSVPIEEAEEGMQLASEANAVRGGMYSFSLPAGHALTKENLAQLRKHEVEFLFVHVDDTRSADQVAVDAAMAARRVIRIFEGADFSDPNMASLFDQVLRFRSA